MAKTHSISFFSLLLLSLVFTACVETPTGPMEPGTTAEGRLGVFEAKNDSPPSQLKVVLFNIMCPLPGGCSRTKLETIADEIRGNDIVMIQELFWDDLHAQLAQLADYPYYVRGPKTISGRQTSGGTVILSRFPFESYSDSLYKNCAGTDCFASKGFQFGRLRIGGGFRLEVANTHMNAAIMVDGQNQTAALQLAQTRQLTDEFKTRKPFDIALFGGDLNYSENGYAPNPMALNFLRSFLDGLGFKVVLESNTVDHLWVADGAGMKANLESIEPRKLSISDHSAYFAQFTLQAR